MAGSFVTLKGHMHICPMVDPGLRPHVGGPVVSTRQNFVCVDGVPIATVSDKCMCTGVPTTAGGWCRACRGSRSNDEWERLTRQGYGSLTKHA